MEGITGGGPVFPLLILFGLNAVDELDRTAFGILLPEIRDHFGLDNEGVLSLVGLVAAIALCLQVPIAHLADRSPRVRLALGGAVAWSLFSVGTGAAFAVWALIAARAGSGIGKAVVDPTHNSLIADYYAPEQRPKVYSFHRAANAVGAFVGPLLAGVLAFSFGWRAPFFVFAVPTLVLVVLGWRLPEPVRGQQERAAMAASDGAVLTEEAPPSLAEAWRLCGRVESLRRIWWSLPFLAASLIGFASLAGLFYEDVFDLDERARGVVAAVVEPAQLLGLLLGARLGSRYLQSDPGRVLRMVGALSFVTAGLLAGYALSPWLWLAVSFNALLTAALAAIAPGILASLAMAIPPRARAMGFSIGSLWILPGLLVLPIVGAAGDRWNLRVGMLLMLPIFVVGGLIVSTAGRVISRDITQVWTAAAARSEVAYERRRGRAKLLLVRDVEVAYGGVQVLFGVDLELEEGQIVALLGTNGAGKSTLLKAISGVVDARRGAIVFDGVDMTATPPAEIAARGVIHMPGGTGTFPSLTVDENLEAASWLHRGDRDALARGRAVAYERFPVLLERAHEPAANLSGGQQQMLALSMALVSRPRLLMIDELSLGLAPVAVEQLLPILRALREQGTTIILVEQSVNVALTVADTAYFMEKGEIRFSGPTAELLERPDILRSVFLAGSAGTAPPRARRAAAAVPPVPAPTLPALMAVGLVRSFGGVRAVDGVSVSVAPQEVLGIIGPNGAGKTTVFDLISGHIPVDDGQVRLGPWEMTRARPHERARRGLGRSFQDARLFPAMTVREALALALERHVEVRDPLSAAFHLPSVYDSEEAVRRRVAELVELLNLGAHQDKLLRELSTGSRRIVDLACVVAHSPSVVLLDEPSSGIAQRETEALAPLLLRLRDELGAAVLVIEHDMPLIREVSDRLVAMDRGRVIAEGIPDLVLAHPDVVASYLGTTPEVVARSGPTTPSVH